MDEASCTEAYDVNVQAEEDPDQFFFTHLDVLEKLRQPIATAFNMTLEQQKFMKMREFIGYCDILYSRKKAGMADMYNFTDQQWHQIGLVNEWVNIDKFTQHARDLYSHQIIAEPMRLMQKEVHRIS